MNKRAWVCDKEGNVLNHKGQIIFDKTQVKDEDIPELYNYDGVRFSVQDVMGDVSQDPSGNPEFHDGKD